MSTLEVACGNCDKRFRVRAEFAGKSTRCPGCSATITISGSKPAPPPREERDERPRPRPRPRDDDDRSALPAGDWRPVDTALGREQVAVIFALVNVVGSFLAFCLMRMAEGFGGTNEPLMVLAALFLVGPGLVSGAFGVTGRVAALGGPKEALGGGAAAASLLCAISAVVAILGVGLAFLTMLGAGYNSGFGVAIAATVALVSIFGAIGTFAAFTAQVGIARRSADVGKAFGRAAVTSCIAVLAIAGIGLFLLLVVEATSGPYRSHDNEEIISGALFGILLPTGFAAVLVGYHRLLAAARLAVRGESAS
jgi:hypothetical protein